MNHISNMLINTYKPLNTLPGLILRNFKPTCTCKHAHTHSWGISSCPLTPAAPCSPLIPPQVRAYGWDGLPRLLPILRCSLLRGDLALLCLSEVRVVQGVSAGGTSGFDYCCFHIMISTPITN